jgi:N-acetylmuramoyl-L-alanine amidase
MLGGSSSASRATDAELYGQTERPLSDVATQLGMKAAWITPEKTEELKSKYSTLDFTANERQMVVNGEPVALGVPLAYYHGDLWMAKKDFDKDLVPLMAPRTLPNPPALHRIVIDPGHGGKDPGGENPGLKLNEKSNTLDVALRLAAILQAKGYEVVMTRKDDHFVELKDRTAIANAAHGDLFLCIHFNIAADAAVEGIETYILTPAGQPSTSRSEMEQADKVLDPGNKFDLWNTVLGFSVERAVTTELAANNRGLKRARYIVLTDLQMPGLLIEGGFLTNPSEGRKIGTPAYRQKLAQGIADGVALYASTLDKARAAQAPAPPPAKKTAGIASSATATGSAGSGNVTTAPASH